VGTVTLPNPLTAGTKARGSEVLANDQAITAQVNANLDDSNYKNAAMTGSTKIIPLTITNSLITAGTLTGDKLADRTVHGIKLRTDAVLGDGCNISELYAGAGSDDTGGFPKTNAVAARKQQGGMTIWAYFGIAVADVNVNYIIDSSTDWRDRLIMVMLEFTTGVLPRDHIPGGASDHIINGPMRVAGAIGTGFNGGIFYSENGQDGTVGDPTRQITLDLGTDATNSIRIFALDTNGRLMVRATAISALGISINAKIDCSPSIGTT
jgi:hypothetical protein